MGRIIACMDSLVDALKSATSRGETVEVLVCMNDLIRKSWAVNTIGYDLGSSICKSLKNRGGYKNFLFSNLYVYYYCYYYFYL